MNELFKHIDWNKVLPLLTGMAGFFLKWALERWGKENDAVVETRRTIERKLGGLLGPWMLDSATSTEDVDKIRRDWNVAVSDYSVTVNGTLFQISSDVNQYLDSVRDLVGQKITRTDLEGRRDLANKLTIPKIPAIRQRRS